MSSQVTLLLITPVIIEVLSQVTLLLIPLTIVPQFLLVEFLTLLQINHGSDRSMVRFMAQIINQLQVIYLRVAADECNKPIIQVSLMAMPRLMNIVLMQAQ